MGEEKMWFFCRSFYGFSYLFQLLIISTIEQQAKKKNSVGKLCQSKHLKLKLDV